MVDGHILYTDSTTSKPTPIKTSSSIRLYQDSTLGYLDDLEQAITTERQKHGQKLLKPRKEKDHDDEPPKGSSGSRNIKVSTTDLTVVI
jgi:hypothetical protein